MSVKNEKPSTGTSTSGPNSETMQNAAFDPNKFLMVPAKTFADLRVGDVFRAKSHFDGRACFGIPSGFGRQSSGSL
jgi:hypothetical protein